MASDSEAESHVSGASLSSPSQKFEYRESDEENLWEVIAITGERKDTYKVRWKGNDPKSQRPWSQSWVPKADCTDDIVMAWKKKKKDKGKRKLSKGKRDSVASKRSRASVASTSKLPASKATNRSGSTHTTSTVTGPNLRRGRSSATSLLGRTATPNAVVKVEHDFDEEGESEVDVLSQTRASNGRKPTSTFRSKQKGKTIAEEKDEDEDEEEEVEVEEVAVKPRKSSASNGRQSATGSASKSKPKPSGLKRKLADAGSANSSANHRRGSTVDVEAEGSGDEDAISTKSSGKKKEAASDHPPPRKKRKVTAQPEPSQSQSQEQESYEIRKVGRKIKIVATDEEEDEEEEHMVEEALSEGLVSPERDRDHDYDYDMDINQGYEGGFEYTAEMPQPDVTESPPRHTPASPPTEPLKISRTPKPQRASTTASPPPASIRIGPPGKKRSVASIVSIVSEPKLNGAPPPSKTQPGANKPRPASRPPPIDQDTESDSDRPVPPLVWDKVQEHRAPTEERSVFWNEEQEHQAILSPAARARLAAFDSEISGQKRKGGSTTSKGSTTTSKTRKPLSSATTSTTTATATNPPRRSTNAATHSYITDIVPETDPENSQSQELRPPADDTAGPSQLPPTTPLGKSTLKSRMKPRTPLSRAVSSGLIPGANDLPRKLRPLPMLSPSVFHALESSLPESIESDDRHKPGANMVDDEEKEEDAPMSSIEQFDSPDKARRTLGRKKVAMLRNPVNGKTQERDRKGKQKEKESAEDIWNSEVVQRGRELAEAARKKSHSRDTSNSSNPSAKKTIGDILAASRSRSASDASLASRHVPESLPEDDDDDEADVDMADASTNVAPPTSGPHAVDSQSQPDEENPDETLQQMESAYVDLNGGAHEDDDVDMPFESSPIASPKDPALLREEEEESTQDLLNDMREEHALQREMGDIDVEAGWGGDPSQPNVAVVAPSPEPSSPKDQPNHGTSDGYESGDSLAVPQITVQHPSRATSVRSSVPDEEGSENGQKTGPMTRSRSRSQTPALPSRRGKSKGKGKKALEIPSPISSRGGSMEPTFEDAKGQGSKAPEAQSDSSSLPPPNSAQLSVLESQLSDEKHKNGTLEQELHSMREQLKQLVEWSSRRDAEAATRVSEVESQHSSDKGAWETENTALIAKVDALERSKASAQKDVDFFREQYAKASGFVSSVRDENKDLEKRLQIAEEQTKTGVNLVRATFERRIKDLEDDAKSWKTMAGFLIEKDKRTDNDALRRRAAEEPELRARCQRQRESLEILSERVDELEEQNKATNNKLDQCQQEAMRLTAELNEARIKLDRIGRAGDEASQGNGHEYVYRCEWRTDNEPCPDVFLTLRELEQHLFIAGHLQHL